MRKCRAISHGSGLGAALAALAIIVGLLLPGVHALQISGAHEPDSARASSHVCGHQHHADHEAEEGEHAAGERRDEAPGHDHHSCGVCKLIELLPTGEPVRWHASMVCLGEVMIGRVWVMAAPIHGVMDARWTPSRGPPMA